MIVKDNLPLNTTEKEGFKHLMKNVSPLYKIPGRKSMTKLIDDKYEALSVVVKDRFNKIEHITLTSDIWTETMNTKSFMGVTAHFFFHEQIHSIIIGVVELSENHTAEYIGYCLMSTCEEWNIPLDKITSVVTDNGSNMVKAVSNVFGKDKHLPCFAHTLDLVASKIVYNVIDVKNTVDKVKAIVTHFKHSVVASDKLRKAQNEENVLKLVQSVPTRWNSVYYMLERFLKLSCHVAPILLQNSKGPAMIDGMEIETIKEVLEILKPIEEVSREISGEKYLTSSKVIPIVNCLTRKLQKLNPSTEGAKELLKITLQELKHRFGPIEQVSLLAFATILDPRFKKIHFQNILACSHNIKIISNMCKEEASKVKEFGSVVGNSNIDQLPSPCDSNKDNIWSYHEELMRSTVIPDDSNLSDGDGIYCDLKTYLKQPTIPLSSDVFLYWKNVMICDHLKKIALKQLTTVATSVPSERLFSKAGAIMTEYRNRLQGERLSKLLFLNSLHLNDWNM